VNKKLRIKNAVAESQKEFDERKPSRDTCPCPSCKQFFGNSTLMMESHKSRYPDHFKTVDIVKEIKAATDELLAVGPAKTVEEWNQVVAVLGEVGKAEAALTENLQGKISRGKKQ
jgi:hypothetical protein